MLVVEDAVELQLAEGTVDVGSSADGRENLVEHAARLDVVLLLLAFLIVACYEVAAAVALLELHLVVKRLDLQ